MVHDRIQGDLFLQEVDRYCDGISLLLEKFFSKLFHFVFIYLFYFFHPMCILQYILANGWKNFFDHWEDLQTEKIAGILCGKVRAIFHPFQLMAHGIGL